MLAAIGSSILRVARQSPMRHLQFSITPLPAKFRGVRLPSVESRYLATRTLPAFNAMLLLYASTRRLANLLCGAGRRRRDIDRPCVRSGFHQSHTHPICSGSTGARFRCVIATSANILYRILHPGSASVRARARDRNPGDCRAFMDRSVHQSDPLRAAAAGSPARMAGHTDHSKSRGRSAFLLRRSFAASRLSGSDLRSCAWLRLLFRRRGHGRVDSAYRNSALTAPGPKTRKPLVQVVVAGGRSCERIVGDSYEPRATVVSRSRTE